MERFCSGSSRPSPRWREVAWREHGLGKLQRRHGVAPPPTPRADSARFVSDLGLWIGCFLMSVAFCSSDAGEPLRRQPYLSQFHLRVAARGRCAREHVIVIQTKKLTSGVMALLTGPHQTSFSEDSSLTTRLSEGDRPVFAPEYAVRAPLDVTAEPLS